MSYTEILVGYHLNIVSYTSTYTSFLLITEY